MSKAIREKGGGSGSVSETRSTVVSGNKHRDAWHGFLLAFFLQLGLKGLFCLLELGHVSPEKQVKYRTRLPAKEGGREEQSTGPGTVQITIGRSILECRRLSLVVVLCVGQKDRPAWRLGI